MADSSPRLSHGESSVSTVLETSIRAIDIDDLPSSPPLIQISSITTERIDTIEEATAEVFQIPKVRPYQIESMHHLAFSKTQTILHLIRHTADGKSLVPMLTGLLRGRVSLVVVPLIGLGSDQVSKATQEQCGVYAYHADEHKGPAATLLRQRILSMGNVEMRNSTILVYISPQSFIKKEWFQFFTTLSKQHNISSLTVDEAHTVEQCGRSFRPEFYTAVHHIGRLLRESNIPILLLFMSATF